MSTSNMLMLQQNHINDSATIMSTNASTTTAPYINGQQNGTTKVVLLTTESMEIDHSRNGKTTSTPSNGTDEELTSLNWLNDKNLLKGINISCPPNIKHMNNNHLKIVTDNASMKPQLQQAMSSKSSSSDAVTPTSDFVDDSGVSEDNASFASSMTSGSEQSCSIYRNVRTTPKPSATTSRERGDSETIENDDNDDANNNTINKNSSNSNLNSNGKQVPPPPPQTTTTSSIIHLGSVGSTVIEYKTVSNLPSKSNIIPNTSSPVSYANPVIVSTNNVGGTTATLCTANVIKTIFTQSTLQSSTQSSTATVSTTTPHTHFHKKYIKAMNALNGSGSDTGTLSPNSITNSSPEAQISSSPTVLSVSTPPPTTIYTIPLKTEFSSAKYEHETVIVENEYPHSAINLISNTNHRIYHGNETDRHSDEYVTPISSPRLQQQPAAPQKISNTINTSSAQTPPTISLPQPTVPLPSVSPNSTQNQPKPSNNVPYDPYIHTNNKPPLSFSSLIFLAIEDAKEKALPVKEIYAWIVKHYPYFKTAPTGWKNSVRHNLSLNKCFQKVEKAPNMGKGSLWRVEQQYKQNLIIALTRSAYHPNTSAMEKATASLKNTPISPDSPSHKPTKRPLDAELFPRLSKFMANMQNGSSAKMPASNNTTDVMNSITDKEYQIHNGNGDYNHVNGDSVIVTTHGIHTNNHEMDAIQTQQNVERIARDWGVDSIEDVNAATAMLALKHGPQIFTETFQTGTPIITTKPSEDHTYSAYGSSAKPGNVVSTIVNVGPAEAEIQFNENNSPPIAPRQIQTKFDANSVNNHGTEIIIDNRHSDNMSNGTSSDAAYESSEESQNDITREEEEARRHQEGVEAFLSFATRVSSMSSPLKRPPSADYVENVPVHIYNSENNNNNNNNYLHANGNGNYYYNGGSSPLDQQYGQQHIYSYMSSPSPPKKSRLRPPRTKLKKKTTWLR